jgi:hypothetical protein
MNGKMAMADYGEQDYISGLDNSKQATSRPSTKTESARTMRGQPRTPLRAVGGGAFRLAPQSRARMKLAYFGTKRFVRITIDGETFLLRGRAAPRRFYRKRRTRMAGK